MFQRVIGACLLAIALTGCAAGPIVFGASTGTVNGHLQLRACGGAYRPEQTECPARPMAGTTVTFQLIDSTSTSTTTTDSSGAYRIDLKPGTYSVQVAEDGSARRGFAGFTGPRTVTVVAGKTVTADFTYTIQLM
ncbi:MAG TPA: carboxypeptidase-like regulatory domain-containing protein [Candidatus Binatus sp.]|nr:carboxypeptidase-like regulatory domain-containing protein [Candidatus Binatus sp.]